MYNVERAQFGFAALETELTQLRDRWGWFLTEGILLSCLGLLVLSTTVLSTLASVLFLGWMLLLAGVVHAVHSLFTGSWRGFFGELITGIFYGIAGVLIIGNPLATAVTLTLMITPLFIVVGLMRMVGSVVYQYPQWGWSFASGGITLAVGIFLWRSMPATGLWLIGTLIGIELFFRGAALSFFALSLRSRVPHKTDLRAAA